MTVPLLQVEGLVKHFPVRKGILGRVQGAVRAVDGVSFDLAPGETLGVVGESGCGKSTLGRLVLRLIEPSAGSIRFGGQDLGSLDAGALRARRRAMQIIFQDPYSSLNPRMTVGQTLAEPLRLHGLHAGSETRRVEELLETVGLAARHARRYPHEFSGGQRQRIGIARALALNPKFIVCDEPIAALDVSIQAQVVNLLEGLQERLGLTYLFISHDLSMVRHIADRVAVMYLGRIVELASRDALYEKPLHPYAQALLSAVPEPDPRIESRRQRIVLTGDVPSPSRPPPGCAFSTRCPQAMPHCRVAAPVLTEVEPGRQVACHLYTHNHSTAGSTVAH